MSLLLLNHVQYSFSHVEPHFWAAGAATLAHTEFCVAVGSGHWDITFPEQRL